MLTYSFHISLFNNLLVLPEKTQVWLNSYPGIYNKIIIKILGYFWGVTEIIGVVKPLLLDERPILRDEAEFLGHAVIEKFLMIVIMSSLFTYPASFRAQFLVFARHRALDKDRDWMIV